jgi:SAM-dependent methyltransferase
MREKLRQFARQYLPGPLYRKIIHATRRPPVGRVDLGSLASPQPISRVWGLDRGQPVDRYYIESFLQQHSDVIRGHVLEIGDNVYTYQYGGERVQKSDILHVSAGSPKATVIADLTQADHVASDQFDAIICTQTLHLIYDFREAIQTLYRILKPGGALLATLPGISQISRYDMDRWGDYWRFTSASARKVFAETFPHDDLQINIYGNVLAGVAFLHGLAVDEVGASNLEIHDPDYEILIGIRAVKQSEGA